MSKRERIIKHNPQYALEDAYTVCAKWRLSFYYVVKAYAATGCMLDNNMTAFQKKHGEPPLRLRSARRADKRWLTRTYVKPPLEKSIAQISARLFFQDTTFTILAISTILAITARQDARFGQNG